MQSDRFEKYLASRHFCCWPVLVLIVLTLLSAAGNYLNLKRHTHEMARFYAQGMVRLINDARTWNAEHGGVYVPTSATTPPNPYLKVPNRDLITDSGLRLTMVNPAYMTREIAEITKRQAGLVMHLTSSNPLNPDNAPDPWENSALASFAAGEPSLFELVSADEGMLYRYMSPLHVSQPCLKCHQDAGYKLGDLRGGISVTFPAAPHLEMISSQVNWMLTGHLVALLLVGTGLRTLLRRLQNQWLARQKLIDEQEHTIAQRTSTLDRQIQRYHNIIKTASEGYWELDPQKLTVVVNPALCKMLGYREDEMLGRSPLDFVDEENAEVFRRQMGNRDTSLHRSCNIELRTKEGRELHTRFHATSMWDEKGQIDGSFAFVTDLTELQEIRQSAASYALKLERSNKELRNFAHIASHDLQEPLRTIVSFGDRLLLKHSQGLDEKGRDYLERMQKAAIRMRQLIEDLLNYSRLTSKEQTFESVDLNAVLQEVTGDLSRSIEEKEARVEVGIMPTVMGDRGQLHRLFLNLIGNALKFQAQGVRPLVRVTAEEIGADQVKITVSDNGIGFDEKYLDRIYRPFQRLHSRSQYQGTGMGLAICKKIVEAHHGELSAHSRPGEGATFVMTFPI